MNFHGGIALIKTTWLSWMQHRGFFFLLAFGWMIPPLIYLFVWSTAAGGETIGGLTSGEFVAYYLILVVVDGRQPGYSEGVTLQELADIIIFHGGHNAINLDGGGSSTMVVEGPLGGAKVINSPINGQIPGRERPVGNHLGIYAKPLKD